MPHPLCLPLVKEPWEPENVDGIVSLVTAFPPTRRVLINVFVILCEDVSSSTVCAGRGSARWPREEEKIGEWRMRTRWGEIREIWVSCELVEECEV